MKALTPALLAQACQTFLDLAYPEGPQSIPPAKRVFHGLSPITCLDTVLVPPVCQILSNPDGSLRGYALRLGSKDYPHLKLYITAHAELECVFMVDTHDSLPLASDHPDAAGWAAIQAENARLKSRIELALENQGLLSFNALLRRDLADAAPAPPS